MVSAGGTEWHNSNRGISLFISIYFALFVLVVFLSKFLHDRPRVASVLPEAGMVILVGMLAGTLTHMFLHREAAAEQGDDNVAVGIAQSLLSFSPTVFFVVLLPPIIFNSGYHLHRGLFFRYILPICLYAIVGTILCTVVVACILALVTPYLGLQPTFLELMAFGALISATDPVSTLAVFSSKKVDPHLFYLVFGESVINDAVGLVLFEALIHLMELESEETLHVGQEILNFLFDFILGFFGSLLLGTVFGLVVAWVLNHGNLRDTPLLELSLYITIMYAPFCVAELCHLSGIVTLLFTGIAARRYAAPNLSISTASHADMIFRVTAHLTETLLFLDLGMSVMDLTATTGQYEGSFHPSFIACALGACLIGRAVNVYPITFLHNLYIQGCRRRRQNHDDNDDDNHNNDDYDGGRSATEYNEYNDDDRQDGIMQSRKEQGVVTAAHDNNKKNHDDGDDTIPWSFAHLIWFAGLRGAVSYGLAKMFPATASQPMIIMTTMMIVLITTFLLGGTTELALNALRIPMNMDEQAYMESIRKKKLLGGGWLHRFERDTVRRWFIRDYVVKQEHFQEDVDEFGFELTEQQHKVIVSQAVYDFGQ